MIDLLFVTVVFSFAIELAVLYEIYQVASDVRRQLAELYARRSSAGSPWPSTSTRPV